MRACSVDLRNKIVESVKKGAPNSQVARSFGVDRSTLMRFCNRFDERRSLAPKK
jgi:transposase